MMRVPVMLTFSSLLPGAERWREWVGPKGWDFLLRQVGDLRQERVGGGEPQRDTGADNERGVDQAGQQEHLGLQLAHQFGLAGSRFEVLAAHNADADTGPDGTQTDDQAGGQCDKADNLHEKLLEDLVDVKRKTNLGERVSARR